MRRVMSCFLAASLALIASTAEADTIHLKNGSVIKGKVASFSDDQFVVMLDTGSGRYMSRATIYMGDVARIEFDSAPAVSSEATQPRDTSSSAQPRDTAPRNQQAEAPQRNNPLAETQPRDTSTSDPQPPPPSTREPETTSVPSVPVASNPAPETSDTDRSSRKLAGNVKTVNVDVVAKRDWTSTGIIVKRGDRIRITASGTITLDPASGQTSGPEGSDLSDARKLMQDRPTGALIGVIGADNDDFIFIGRSAEFTATRDGLLFLSVNEGALSDNAGLYKATLEVQQSQGRSRP